MDMQRMTAEFETAENLVSNFAEPDKRKRVRLTGTAIKVFSADDGNYAFIVIDDGTETIRVKAFREDVQKMSGIKEGNLVQVIGWASFYNDEVYIRPEIVSKLTPDEFYFNKIWAAKISGKKEADEKEPDFDILGFLEKNPKASVEMICRGLGISNDACIANLKVLLEEGVVYEPAKGCYAVI